jgi:hypothetical protein
LNRYGFFQLAYAIFQLLLAEKVNQLTPSKLIFSWLLAIWYG